MSPSISSNSEYDYQAYYSDSKNYVNNAEPVYQTTETVTDTNGVVYTTTETYYDADFATRIKRFGTQASSTRDYYDDYYTYSDGNTYVYVNSYDPFYWDYYPTYYYGWSYRPYWSSYWSFLGRNKSNDCNLRSWIILNARKYRICIYNRNSTCNCGCSKRFTFNGSTNNGCAGRYDAGSLGITR